MRGNFLAALFTCQVLQLSSTATLDVTVEHKNLEDTSFSTLGTFTQFVTAIVKTTSLAGIKEQFRFKYEVGGSNACDAVRVRMDDPAWRPY